MGRLEDQRRPTEFPRRFLDPGIDLGDWAHIEPHFRQLLIRDLSTAKALEQWLLDRSELEAAIAEESSARYIEMTCHTDDSRLEAAYLHYVEHILPKTEPLSFELNRKYMASAGREHLPPERYLVHDRDCQNEVDIFREDNVPLQTRDEVLSQEYQKVCGEMTAEFDGREHTLPQLYRYLEETDRPRRREAWTAMITRRLADRERLERLYDEMIGLRTRIARNAGFESYVGYRFRQFRRFDYTVDDCMAFHETMETVVMPLQRALSQSRRAKMGLARLAPWDLNVDPLGRPPLRPFEDAAQLAQGARQIFHAIDQCFAADFEIMRERGLLDLESRKGKAPGGYQCDLEEVRLPFIFMNAAGRNTDVFTLLHEGGHAFHALAARQDPLVDYRHAPIEFCEVASMGMEMMGCERLGAFYDPESATRARRMHLEEIIALLPYIARVDAFQHWIYNHPAHSRSERESQWLKLDERFGDNLDWCELPEWRGCNWQAKSHFFCHPFYYIEYGIAQLGALQLWANFQEDPGATVQAYRGALAMGGSRPLPELFESAGLRFAFDKETVAPLVDRLAKALGL